MALAAAFASAFSFAGLKGVDRDVARSCAAVAFGAALEGWGVRDLAAVTFVGAVQGGEDKHLVAAFAVTLS